MKTFPTLYKKTSTGKIQMWEIKVVDYPQYDGGQAPEVVTTYGLLDGKQQTAIEKIKGGKNLGKANETTPVQQAELEAQSQWEKKVKKGYVQNIDDAQEGKIDTNLITGGVDPMLAKSYDKDSKKITYPAYVQPKLDGHRCIAIIQDGKCTLWSRTRKPITGVPHIARALEAAYPNTNVVIDGELYNHDYKDRFEELTSLIRQAVPKPGHEVVQYWVYDIVMEGVPFSERKGFLDQMERYGVPSSVVPVSTHLVENEEEMISSFGVFIDFGFEGLMVRNAKGLYKGKRSADLQKVKMMQDAEYPVVAIEEGKGKMAGKAMFVCDAGNGKTFRVKMKGALEDLKDYFENPEPWIGKQLTVQFQKFSADGMPIFPVGLRIREDI